MSDEKKSTNIIVGLEVLDKSKNISNRNLQILVAKWKTKI